MIRVGVELIQLVLYTHKLIIFNYLFDTEKKSKKHSEQKSKKGKGEDEVDGKAAAVATPDKAAVKDEAAQLLPSVKPSTELEMPPQTKPVYPLGQPQPTSEKKAESQNLVQTPTTTANKEQPPPATEKKVYPKEKHPKVTKSPKFGQRLLTAPPKEKPPAKPEPVVKPSSEQKRFETKPVVTKPVESVISPHRKAPEPPVERASPKPKPKVTIIREEILVHFTCTDTHIYRFQLSLLQR